MAKRIGLMVEPVQKTAANDPPKVGRPAKKADNDKAK